MSYIYLKHSPESRVHNFSGMENWSETQQNSHFARAIELSLLGKIPKVFKQIPNCENMLHVKGKYSLVILQYIQMYKVFTSHYLKSSKLPCFD